MARRRYEHEAEAQVPEAGVLWRQERDHRSKPRQRESWEGGIHLLESLLALEDEKGGATVDELYLHLQDRHAQVRQTFKKQHVCSRQRPTRAVASATICMPPTLRKPSAMGALPGRIWFHQQMRLKSRWPGGPPTPSDGRCQMATGHADWCDTQQRRPSAMSQKRHNSTEPSITARTGTASPSVLWTALRWLALLALCGAYLQGGLVKALDFPAAVAEMNHFGMTPAPLFALAVIVLELGCSAMVLLNRFRWLGALALAAFTVVASFLANRFWAVPAAEQFATMNAFFEHIGLAGAFCYVAWTELAPRQTG